MAGTLPMTRYENLPYQVPRLIFVDLLRIIHEAGHLVEPGARSHVASSPARSQGFVSSVAWAPVADWTVAPPETEPLLWRQSSFLHEPPCLSRCWSSRIAVGAPGSLLKLSGALWELRVTRLELRPWLVEPRGPLLELRPGCPERAGPPRPAGKREYSYVHHPQG